MIKKTIGVEYEIGDVVYLLTDTEQLERIVTGYEVRTGGVSYLLSHLVHESKHYQCEIVSDKDFVKATSS